MLRADLARRATLSLRGRPIGVDLYGLGGREAALALARLGLTPSDVNLVDLPPERAADALAEGSSTRPSWSRRMRRAWKPRATPPAG